MTGLADAYLIQAFWRWYPLIEGYAKARLFALKALEIDHNLAEAHATLGAVLTWWEWEWEDARKEFLLALACNPNYGMARQYYAELLCLLGEKEEARKQLNIALELDPLSLITRQVSSYQYYCEGRTEKAMDEIKITQEIDSTFVSSLWIRWRIFISKSEGLKALEDVQKIYAATPEMKKYTKDLKVVYDKAGLEGMIKFIMELEQKNLYPQFNLALHYAQLKNNEKVMEYLEKAYEMHIVVNVYIEPEFKDIRNDPRSWELMKKMGFSVYFENLSVPMEQ
jgi:tetratricopeptide (TPR) repeat protein